jgi:acylglycerol lipase
MSDAADGTFAGVGGVSIYWQRSAPAGAPRGVVLISHGYAEHCGRYRELVAHLNARGLATAALDHRGHGRSGGPRGHCTDFTEFTTDLRTLADHAARWWPGVPRLLFGHSMGGLIALGYLVRHGDTVRAAALSAPAITLPGGAPPSMRIVAAVLGPLWPTFSVQTALDESLLSRDPAVGRAYVADPLVHRQATAGFMRAMMAAQATVPTEAATIRVPVLLMQGDADRIVDPAGATMLAGTLTGPHEFETLPGYYHELLNEPATMRERVVALLDQWFDRWLAT